MLFKYMCKFRTSSEKFEIRTIQISWKIYKILKTVEFFNMWLFISKIKNLYFFICQNTHFCYSGLGQVSSWWINSIFCVGKVSIWRCLLMRTFSGLHFLFCKYPMNFQPQWTRICQNTSLCSICIDNFCSKEYTTYRVKMNCTISISPLNLMHNLLKISKSSRENVLQLRK